MWSAIAIHHLYLLFLHSIFQHCLELVQPTSVLLPALPPLHNQTHDPLQDLESYGHRYHVVDVEFHVQKEEEDNRRGRMEGAKEDEKAKEMAGKKVMRKLLQGGNGRRRRRNRMKKKKELAEIEKRMGSRPPLCSNKCNACHPCLAIQVPTPLDMLSSIISNNPSSSSSKSSSRTSISNSLLHQHPHSSSSFSHLDYSNYQPEGWKCKCGNLIFNP